MSSYNNWYDKIKEHLSKYKTNVLHITKDGVWKGNGKTYSHILPIEDGESNYLCDAAKTSLEESEKHQDWNHLNSSQTLCVNYFAPLRVNNDNSHLSILLSRLLSKEIKIADSLFEYVPVLKSTNFDFYAKDESINQYFFEIKYTEDGITKSGGGHDPAEAYELYYKEDVKNNPVFVNVTEDMFLNKHFQAYRNMVKGKGGDYSFFITMRSNPNTFKELQLALSDLRVRETPNVIILYWEDLIDLTIELFSDDKNLSDYYKQLKEKYIPNCKEK